MTLPISSMAQEESNPESIPIGPRHRKLLMSFEKAVASIISKCSLEKIREIFPEILSESTFVNHEEEQCENDILALAYSKAITFFQEKLKREWDDIVKEYQLTDKLDALDDAISTQNPDNPVFQWIFKKWNPVDVIRDEQCPVKLQWIEKLTAEIDESNETNVMLIERIKDLRSNLASWKSQFKDLEGEWNATFSQCDHRGISEMQDLAKELTNPHHHLQPILE